VELYLVKNRTINAECAEIAETFEKTTLRSVLVRGLVVEDERKMTAISMPERHRRQ
jgi:hypothetical protein